MVTGEVNAWRCAHAYGYFCCSLPGDVRAYHGLFRTLAFETAATFHIEAKKTLDSAVVHSNKSKDQSLAFVGKHCYHPFYISLYKLATLRSFCGSWSQIESSQSSDLGIFCFMLVFVSALSCNKLYFQREN